MRRLSDWLRKNRIELLSVLGLLIVTASMWALFRNWHLDRSFITYRTAQNLAAGEGFVYNVGGLALSDTVAPLYVAILALGSTFTADLPSLSNLTGTVAIGLSALALYLTVHPAGRLPAALAGLVAASLPLLWMSLGLDALLWMAFGLLALWLYTLKRGRLIAGSLAAVLLGLATLMRPEIAALAVVLAVDAVLTGRRVNPAAPGLYVLIVAGGLLVLSQTPGGRLPGLPGVLGTPLPADLFAPTYLAGLKTQAAGFFALSPLWALTLPLGAAGVVRLITAPQGTHGSLLLVAWAALHAVSLLILQAGVEAWQFAPLVLALIVLAALGVGWLAGRLREGRPRQLAAGAGALLMLGAAAHSLLTMTGPGDGSAWRGLAPPSINAAYAQAGQWIAANTPPGVQVGADEIGVLGYTSARPLVDAAGRLQPDIAAAQARGDGVWWLSEYAPEVLVLSDSTLVPLADDAWFNATYAEVGRLGPAQEVGIWQRTSTPEPLTRQLTGLVTYPVGVTLSGIATDFSLDPLDEGRTARVRLEWLLDEPQDAAQQVALRIESRDGAIAALESEPLDFSGAPVGEAFTTYHTLTLAPSLQPGVYELSVGLGPDQDGIEWQAVAQGKVPFPETAFVGAVAGSRTEFGDIALVGYRLSRTEGQIEIVLMWQAIEQPQADYRVFVQVRGAQGDVAAYVDGEPRGGAYPTSVWSAGENVSDTITIERATLPPGSYEVYAGLLDADGDRLLTLDGRDAALVGQLSISE